MFLNEEFMRQLEKESKDIIFWANNLKGEEAQMLIKNKILGLVSLYLITNLEGFLNEKNKKTIEKSFLEGGVNDKETN